jgi:hypothetical protein
MIAQHTMFNLGMTCLLDRWSDFKFGIGDPHWQNIFAFVFFPFTRKSTRAVNAFVKVLQVTRDLEGDWQFTCGDDAADETSDLHLLAVGELLQRDISLSDAVVLEPGQGIERGATYKDWDTFALEE